MSQQSEGIIDVERRKSQAEYTLGDPTVFPPEFLVWLKRYIEQSGITLPASSIFGTFTPGAGLSSLAAGIIIPYAGGTAPAGSLPANGQSVGRDAFPKLFDAIGVTYGSVDAASFTLPDYRGRTLIGLGVTDVPALTTNDGLALANRSPKHRHTVTDPGHSHGQDGFASPTTYIAVAGGGVGGFEHINTGSATTGVKVGPGPTTAPLDTPAYHGVLYVITTG